MFFPPLLCWVPFPLLSPCTSRPLASVKSSLNFEASVNLSFHTPQPFWGCNHAATWHCFDFSLYSSEGFVKGGAVYAHSCVKP